MQRADLPVLATGRREAATLEDWMVGNKDAMTRGTKSAPRAIAKTGSENVKLGAANSASGPIHRAAQTTIMVISIPKSGAFVKENIAKS
jgi:hypothetical protein